MPKSEAKSHTKPVAAAESVAFSTHPYKIAGLQEDLFNLI